MGPVSYRQSPRLVNRLAPRSAVRDSSFMAVPSAPIGRQASDVSRSIGLPLVFTLGLAAFGLLDSVRQNPRLLWSFLGAAAALARLERGSPRIGAAHGPHAHAGDRPAEAALPPGVRAGLGPPVLGLVLASGVRLGPPHRRPAGLRLRLRHAPQLVAARHLHAGLRSVPGHLQHQPVSLVQAGLVLPAVPHGGARLRGQRADPLGQGRPRAHIFNPSSFPLAVFSLGLILTGTSDLTWGQDIASTQFYPPHMYLMLFLIGLPGQFFFGVTSMTMSAVVTTYLFGLLYFAATGIYFFYDSYIPIAVFLGMHLLFTDPSTSPRTELGRLIFGVLYGLSTVALYELLGSAGLPTFYDKLLQVPLLNLSIKLIDRAARSKDAASVRPRGARPMAGAPPAQPGVHVDLGDRVCGDERRARSRRPPSRPVAAILAAGLQG